MLPGDDALVAGFIVTPGQPKELLLRGLGPSLPMAGALADPTIELFEENGIAFAFNDNWRDEQTVPDVRRTLPPTNPLESALWGILNPGA